jgi:uroporphyrin-III C-methyltransferase
MRLPDESGILLAGARGRVALVGAGPGDPELLTVRAHRLLACARIVAYDELVSPEILAIAPPSAERIPVGRRRGTRPDAPSIHPAVLERALAGHDVVRLKGGDPLVFGRGGEEAEQLAALGIPFEIVPGVSAALGAAASTGIPLTHRDAASSVTLATAHARHDGAPERSQPGALAARVPAEGTVVFYMGLATLAETAAALVAGGRAPSTPVAVVSHATLPSERLVVSDLARVAADVADAGLATPALVIVGDVVAHRAPPAARAAGGSRTAQRPGAALIHAGPRARRDSA